jgi:hypothetical protein
MFLSDMTKKLSVVSGGFEPAITIACIVVAASIITATAALVYHHKHPKLTPTKDNQPT